jgi:hypothetical protein
MYTKFWSENLKVRDLSVNLGVDGRIILEWILEIQWEVNIRTDFRQTCWEVKD